MFDPINYWAVVVSGVIFMVVGMLWYSPALFGKVWMKAMKMTKEQCEEGMKKNMGPTYAMMYVATLVKCFVLAHVINFFGAMSAVDGMMVGFWMWLGFIATTRTSDVFFEQKSWKLYGINVGYDLVCLMATGALLAVWA